MPHCMIYGFEKGVVTDVETPLQILGIDLYL